MSTHHIGARTGDIAPTVLMPGDPRRAERIARVLEDARLVTDVRGMLGFTGTIDGSRVTVMGSGMGMPSATIYATELFDVYGVERIIRVGTAGGIAREVGIGDVVVATGAHTDSAMNERRLPGYHFSAVADFDLACAAVAAHRRDPGGARLHVGTIVSQDHFYLTDGAAELDVLARYGVLVAEMEAAALYACAAEFGRSALAVLTVTDLLADPAASVSAEQRETGFGDALRLAVAAAAC